MAGVVIINCSAAELHKLGMAAHESVLHLMSAAVQDRQTGVCEHGTNFFKETTTEARLKHETEGPTLTATLLSK